MTGALGIELGSLVFGFGYWYVPDDVDVASCLYD